MKQQTFTAPCRGGNWVFSVGENLGPVIQVVNRRLSIMAWAPVRSTSVDRRQLAIALTTARTQIRLHAKREDKPQ